MTNICSIYKENIELRNKIRLITKERDDCYSSSMKRIKRERDLEWLVKIFSKNLNLKSSQGEFTKQLTWFRKQYREIIRTDYNK